MKFKKKRKRKQQPSKHLAPCFDRLSQRRVLGVEEPHPRRVCTPTCIARESVPPREAARRAPGHAHALRGCGAGTAAPRAASPHTCPRAPAAAVQRESPASTTDLGSFPDAPQGCVSKHRSILVLEAGKRASCPPPDPLPVTSGQTGAKPLAGQGL